MATIEFRRVQIAYGATVVVRDLDLRIEDGEFVVLVGPSGCGKSTILRSIAGLENVAAGELRIGDRVVNGVDPAARDIAMVFQNYALFPNMSVADNITFGARIRREPRPEVAARLAEVAALMQLGDHLHKKPGALSGGQRQRVALARAIMRHPGAFLFDEPLSNLDADFRAAMRSELIRLHRRLGATMVYVTHDQVEAMTMGDRIAVLAPLAQCRGSNLMQLGRPEEIYAAPANLFVARFIGSPRMNLFEAERGSDDVRLGPWRFPPPVRAASDAGSVTVGLRPEHVSVAPAAGPDGLPARVETVENYGHERVLTCSSEFGRVVVRTQGAGSDATAGDTLTLLPQLDRAHLFASQGGERLEQRSPRLRG